MKQPTPASKSTCSDSLLLEFLDGELTPNKEQEIGTHIASCPACKAQLDQQKNLLAELDDSLDEQVELPANFSKIVSANARSQVSAIRRPYERRTALAVCIGLFAILSLAVAFGPLNAFFGPTAIVEKVFSVLELVFGFLTDIFLGFGIIGRAFSTSVGISPLIIFGVIIGAGIILAVRRNQKTTRLSGVSRPDK